MFIYLCRPSKKRGHIALHMLVGLSVCLSICNLFCFWPITRERLDLPSSNLVQTSVLGSRGNPIDFGVTGSNVKVTKVNVPKIFQIVSETISRNEFLLHHTFLQLISNWLISSCTKYFWQKALGSIMFYEHLLFYFCCSFI